MTPHDLLANFETLAEAPNGIQRLRELVLELAVRGKLVEQDPRDEPAEVLLKKMRGQKLHPGKIGAQETPQPHPDAGEFPHPVPSTWLWVRLEQVAEYNGRSNVDPDEITPDEWVLDLEDIEKETSRILKRVSNGVRISKSTKSTFCKGDVLFGKLRPYLNKVIVADQGGVCTTEIVPIVPAPGLDSEYLRLLLKRPGFLKWVDQLTYGVKMPRLGTSDAKRSLHPLPPSNEQRRIVARVDELMALLDRLEAKRQEREAARTAARDSALAALREAPTPDDVETAWLRIQERFHELFATPEDVEPLRALTLKLAVRGKLVKQDAADEPADELLRRIQTISSSSSGARTSRSKAAKASAEDQEWAAAEGAPLPRGWRCTPLRRLITLMDAGWSPACPGHPTGSDEEWGVLKTTAIQANSFEPQYHKALPAPLTPRPDCEVMVGDVLITRAGPWFRVGVSCYVSECRPRLMLSDKIIRCRLTQGLLDGRWIALCINHGRASGFLRSKQTGMDAAQVNISQGRLASAPIEIPPLAEQRRIVARVDELMTLLDRLSGSLSNQSGLAEAFAAAAVHHLDV